MIIAVDFDGTVVGDTHAYDDLNTPLRFVPGARSALFKMKAAGHTLILFSGRANPWLLRNPEMDPLVMAGLRKVNDERWVKNRTLNQARYVQMITFVKRELSGVFSLIWEHQGKPSADVFIDDRAAPFRIDGWSGVAHLYGQDSRTTMETR